jgi:hypothetical protein
MTDWVLISLWAHGWATGLFVGWALGAMCPWSKNHD